MFLTSYIFLTIYLFKFWTFAITQGVWGDGEFTKLDDLIKTVTSMVYILTCVHAAANFNQYDEYGFAPNMPFKLNGLPPKNKVCIQPPSITFDRVI